MPRHAGAEAALEACDNWVWLQRSAAEEQALGVVADVVVARNEELVGGGGENAAKASEFEVEAEGGCEHVRVCVSAHA